MTYTYQRHGQGIGKYPVDIPKGYWTLVTDPAYPGITLVQTQCPLCGESSLISPRIHSIALDGTLHPSLVCQQYNVSTQPPVRCTFHEWVRLEGWVPGEAPAYLGGGRP